MINEQENPKMCRLLVSLLMLNVLYIYLFLDSSFGGEPRPDPDSTLIEKYPGLFGVNALVPYSSDQRVFPEDLALQWLAKVQEEDGRWDSKKHGAENEADLVQTSWTALAFLSCGQMEKDAKQRKPIVAALNWILKHQKEDGEVRRNNDNQSDGCVHALAGWALSEAACRDANFAALIQAAKKAVGYSIKHQAQKDGVTFGFGKECGAPNADLLATTLFSLQMRAAEKAGLAERKDWGPGVERQLKTLRKGRIPTYSWFDSSGGSPGTLLFACLCHNAVRGDPDEFKILGSHALDAPNSIRSSNGFTDSLSTYVATRVAFDMGGETWIEFNKSMRPYLLGAQVKKGEFAGSWDPFGRWEQAGRVLQTALNVLAIRVYYRFLQAFEN